MPLEMDLGELSRNEHSPLSTPSVHANYGDRRWGKAAAGGRGRDILLVSSERSMGTWSPTGVTPSSDGPRLACF